MSRTSIHIVILIIAAFFTVMKGFCQESIFTALKSNLKRGDEYFQEGSYAYALELYLAVEKKNKAIEDIELRIARTYYQLKDNENTADWYDQYCLENTSLPEKDDLTYAEALTSLGKYEMAIRQYKRYLKKYPKDKRVAEKIWRLKNINYLYEDSVYYAVKALNINTDYAEFGPHYLGDSLIFVSNRKMSGGISKIDDVNNASYQALYFAEIKNDSLDKRFGFSLGKPKQLFKGAAPKFHRGIFAFFPGEDKLIYTKNIRVKSSETGSRWQLFVAEKKEDTWKDTQPFAHNNSRYTIYHPALSPDGTTLFFSSDMPGGFGGKDLYRCLLVNDEWTKPENLGNGINTSGDETFPFYHRSGVLYFSSTGHSGLGGLDIFKATVNKGKFEEVQNAGYPINTSFDDFSIVLNPEGSHGFFSSNRNKGKFNDDIFAVKIDLQTYPLTISGVLKYKTHGWQDSSNIAVLPNADLFLIDNNKNETVYQTTTDSSGRFALNIPYSSQYKIKVFEKDIGHKLVSLEIPRNKKLYTNHQIVIVNDQFKDPKGGETGSVKPTGSRAKKQTTN